LHGDYYGPTVNLAARLVAVAPPSTALVSDAVRDGAPADGALTFEPFDTGSLRGFPDVTSAYRLQQRQWMT
jgi:class 3 adenylate cyclase